MITGTTEGQPILKPNTSWADELDADDGEASARASFRTSYAKSMYRMLFHEFSETAPTSTCHRAEVSLPRLTWGGALM